jgi:hypothetical protein
MPELTMRAAETIDHLRERLAAAEAAFAKERLEHINDIACGERRLIASESREAALRADLALRPEVIAFARAMHAKIEGHNHDRGEHGWRAADAQRLMLWLRSYVATLDEALPERHGSLDPLLLLSKAANVANLAMMIADVAGALASPATRTTESAPPCGGSRCHLAAGGTWIHSSKSYDTCSVRTGPETAEDASR